MLKRQWWVQAAAVLASDYPGVTFTSTPFPRYLTHVVREARRARGEEVEEEEEEEEAEQQHAEQGAAGPSTEAQLRARAAAHLNEAARLEAEADRLEAEAAEAEARNAESGGDVGQVQAQL
jgi:hypothetical protein